MGPEVPFRLSSIFSRVLRPPSGPLCTAGSGVGMVEMGIDPEDRTEARTAVVKKRFREASVLAKPVAAS